jgi:hypothetical protein
MLMSRMTASHALRSSHDWTFELSVSDEAEWPFSAQVGRQKAIQQTVVVNDKEVHERGGLGLMILAVSVPPPGHQTAAFL